METSANWPQSVINMVVTSRAVYNGSYILLIYLPCTEMRGCSMSAVHVNPQAMLKC